MVAEANKNTEPFSKLLSLVVCGRNDSYQGNFLYRLTTCINFTAHQLDKIHRLQDVELIVGDWHSDEPLSEALPLTELARKICRFVYIPLHSAKKLREDGGFFATGALNAGLRRATGEYRTVYDADSLLPASSFLELFDLLEGKIEVPFDPKKALFYFNRHHIPWERVQSQPTLEEWEEYLFTHGHAIPADSNDYGIGGWGAGQMAHKDLWQILRGYNETLKGYGWTDVELTLRATQEYPLIYTTGFGIHLYHMEHWARNKRRVQVDNNFSNPFLVSDQITVNNEDWGSGDENLSLSLGVEHPTLPPFARNFPPFSGYPEFTNATKSTENLDSLKNYLSKISFIQQLDEKHETSEPIDQQLLLYLGGYALEFMPKTFYYYGATQAFPIGIIAQNCCSMSIFLVNHWDNSEQNIWHPLARISAILNRVDFKGTVRHLTGNPSSALSRLRKSSSSRLEIDLALIQDFISPEDTSREIVEIISHLSPTSMLFVLSETEERMDQILSALEKAPYEFHRLRGNKAVLFKGAKQ